MNFFNEATLRLKQLLHVTQDKDVAAVLGLSPRAWAGRKKSDSFPEIELRALAQQRPDLKINVDYVLTGTTEEESLRQRDALHTAAGLSRKSADTQPLSNDEQELVALYRAASLAAKVAAVQALQKKGAK